MPRTSGLVTPLEFRNNVLVIPCAGNGTCREMHRTPILMYQRNQGRVRVESPRDHSIVSHLLRVTILPSCPIPFSLVEALARGTVPCACGRSSPDAPLVASWATPRMSFPLRSLRITGEYLQLSPSRCSKQFMKRAFLVDDTNRRPLYGVEPVPQSPRCP